MSLVKLKILEQSLFFTSDKISRSLTKLFCGNAKIITGVKTVWIGIKGLWYKYANKSDKYIMIF